MNAQSAEGDRTPSLIGQDGEHVEVYAFRGGGFEALMYLGVIQAHLILGRPDPHVLSGVSAGAVAAAAMTRVLRERSLELKAERLREFVIELAKAPGMFLQSLVPDMYEIEARRPLKSLVQPTHAECERKARESALAARQGLINLVNDLLANRLTVGQVTRLTRVALGYVGAGDAPTSAARLRGRLGASALGLGLCLLYTRALAPLLGAVVIRLCRGSDQRPVTAAQALALWRRLGRRVAQGGGRALSYPIYPFAILLLGAIWIIWQIAEALFGQWPRTTGGSPQGRFGNKLLASYDLAAELGSSYDLKQLLIRLFDPEYFGGARLDVVQERTIAREKVPFPCNGQPSTLASLHADGRLRFTPAAAQLASGQLVLIPDTLPVPGSTGLVVTEVPIVDSLMAALAVSPLFKPVELTYADDRDPMHALTRNHIDGTNIANEPIGPIMGYLRHRLNPAAGKVTVHAVSPFPSTGHAISEVYTGLVKVVRRVRTLQRVQIATLERRLTEYYSRAIRGANLGTLVDSKSQVLVGSERGRFVAASIHPIEPRIAPDVSKRLLAANNDTDRLYATLDAVAAGCSATLKAFSDVAREIPGSDSRLGYGLAEVCARCSTNSTCRSRPSAPSPDAKRIPVEVSSSAPSANPCLDSTPWASVVLSGGIFRGVFQLGVLVAMREAGLKPRLFVGSSVGSLVATMAASLFAMDRSRQPAAIARMAVTFLGLDQIMLTDRFSDSVRRLTLRAGDTRMAPRDFDQIFRRYDRGGIAAITRVVRRVAGGLDRLLYLTPYESIDLFRMIRMEQWERLPDKLSDAAQYLLERSGIGFEALGAENLARLIQQHALEETNGWPWRDVLDVPLDHFSSKGRHLVVTATNLQRGELHLFGMDKARGKPVQERLMAALLASSAFPGVFRPRYNSEVLSNPSAMEQLTDGGVIDNLPLFAVPEFLAQADGRLTTRRPQYGEAAVPHLLIAGSLEPERKALTEEEERGVARSWVAVRTEAKRIAFNQKVEAFAKAQFDFRSLYDQSAGNATWIPVDLHVVPIKAQWLCPSFGFHPMLGFRRARQAASIAHGCATTLARLWRTSVQHPSWANGWGLELGDMDPDTVRIDGEGETGALELHPARRRGGCWFRKDSPCPFSKQFLTDDLLARRLDPSVIDAVDQIYHACGNPKTHGPIGAAGR